MKMREFTRVDWYGLCGAEKPINSEPLLNDEPVMVGGIEAQVVVDDSRVEFQIYFAEPQETDDEIAKEYVRIYYRTMPFHVGRELVENLGSELSEELLTEGLGFTATTL